MEFIKKYKTALIGLAVVLIGGAAYMYFRGTDTPTDGTIVYDASAVDQSFTEGQEILAALEELRRLKIDTAFFESSVFKSLTDQSAATTSLPIGRSDPFEPFPKPPSSTSGGQGFVPTTR